MAYAFRTDRIEGAVHRTAPAAAMTAAGGPGEPGGSAAHPAPPHLSPASDPARHDPPAPDRSAPARPAPDLSSAPDRPAPDPIGRQRPDLEVTVAGDGPEVVVAVRGQVDLSVIGQLERCTEPALQAGRRLVLDLAGTTFMDTSGVNLIVRAYQRLGRAKEAVVVRSPGPSVLRTLMLAGLDEIVTIETRSRPRA